MILVKPAWAFTIIIFITTANIVFIIITMTFIIIATTSPRAIVRPHAPATHVTGYEKKTIDLDRLCDYFWALIQLCRSGGCGMDISNYGQSVGLVSRESNMPGSSRSLVPEPDTRSHALMNASKGVDSISPIHASPKGF